MPSTRILPLAALVVGALALTGCIVAPPALAPQQTTPTTTAPEPSDPESSDPAPSVDPGTPTTDSPAAPGDSTVTLDGQPVGSWGTTLTCFESGGSLFVTSGSEDESGSLVAGAELVDGAWLVTGLLMTNGDDVYFQTDETAPAAYDGGVLMAEVPISDFTGGTATVAVTVTC